MMNNKKVKSKGSALVRSLFESSHKQKLFEPPLAERSETEIFFNTCFDKNQLKKIIAWFLEKYGQKKTVDLVETFKQIGFHQATLAGVSLGIEDLQIPPQKASLLSQASVKMVEVNQALLSGNLTSVEKSQRLIDTWNQTSETLRQAAVQNFRSTNPVNPVYMMAFSGARGNISQVRQLVAMRGLMADPQGAILEFPIQSNFREGLTVTEYLISCFGARKGLVDTALRTATSGYLTRRLVDAVQHVVVHVTNCHTTKGILIKEKNVEQRLVGRVLLKDMVLDSTTIIKRNTLISPRLAKKIAAQQNQIFVRSPLTCQTEKSVCQLCYGIDLAQGKLVSLGEAVGIIAAQSIGEPGTQLTMRTFHTGGVGVFSDQAMKAFLAPFEGKVCFAGSLPGIFVRTPHGNIVYLLKQKSTDPEAIFLRLTGFQSSLKSSLFEIKHKEVPAGSLLWVKQGEFVKLGQLLVQASRLQASKQEMPESTHPVRASLSGEVFFESIKTRLIEKGKLVKTKTKKHHKGSILPLGIKDTSPFLSTKTEEIKGEQQKEKMVKEIIPTIPFLRELGNFWVFSCFVQKEIDISRSFLVKGDLISTHTPIHQYNLQVSEKGQLKQTDSSLSFAQPVFQARISKAHYSQGFYFFTTASQNFLTYTTNPTFSQLTWYPFLHHVSSPSFPFFQNGTGPKTGVTSIVKKNFKKGYCVKLSVKCDYLNSEFSEKRTEYSSIFVYKNGEKLQDVSYLWSPHEVFKFNVLEHSLSLFFSQKRKQIKLNSCFLVALENPTLSKKGIFQCKQISALVWTKKNLFQPHFVKNPFFCKKNQLFTGAKNKIFGNPFLSTKTETTHPLPKIKFLAQETRSQKTKRTVLNLVSVCKPRKANGGQIDQKLVTITLSSCFVENGLKRIHKILPGRIHTKLIEKKQGWFVVSTVSKSDLKKSQLIGVILEPGKKFENFSFSHSYVSINVLSRTNLFFIRRNNSHFEKTGPNDQKRPWSKKSFNFHEISRFWEVETLLSKNQFSSRNSSALNNLINSRLYKRVDSQGFCFYKKEQFDKKQKASGPFFPKEKKEKALKPFTQVNFKLYKKIRLCSLLLIQKNFYENIPQIQVLYQNCVLEKKNPFPVSLNSPFFTKQTKTRDSASFLLTQRHKQQKIRGFGVFLPLSSGWMSLATFLKVGLQFQMSKPFRKIDEFRQKAFFSKLDPNNTLSTCLPSHSSICEKNYKNSMVSSVVPKKRKTQKHAALVAELSVSFSRRLQLKNADTYRYQGFDNGWVLPNLTITRAFLLSKQLGEFHRIQKKQDHSYMSLLRTPDLVCLVFSKTQRSNSGLASFCEYKNASTKLKQVPKVGGRVRWGQEVVEDFAGCVNGQLIKTTRNKLTIRKGVPLLASLRGLLHVTQGDMVQKNQILITLRSRRLQTEDIVQGIPKIEQLFEARETQGGELLPNNMHLLLKKFFSRAVQVKTLREAVDLSVTYIQNFLVENILQAYSNQGVQIAEKHVEIVVRQMTARIRITHGGDSGFLPGELVQLRVIETINEGLALRGHRQAEYEPVILGITKSVLQSESFLLAASFQQVSKVLVRSALAKKTDFLRGLHENLLVGQPIPAGTGVVTSLNLSQKILESLDP